MRALLPALVSPSAVGMCIAKLAAGFPHAHVRHYPANIRGILFQAPLDSPLSAQHFVITSPDDRRSLRLRFEPVILPADSAAERTLPRGTQLVRVMLADGYAPGSTYSIRYTAPRDLSTQYADAITFTIDPAPVELTGDHVSFLLHRPQVRMHVVMTGDTGVGLIAATRRLETRVTATLRPYQDAVSFFPEWANIGENGTAAPYTALRQTASFCSGESFGAGAGAGDRPDVVYQDCQQRLQSKAVRVSAGLLELDDRLHALPVMRADWDAGSQAACSAALRQPLSKREVREAMASGILPAAASTPDGR